MTKCLKKFTEPSCCCGFHELSDRQAAVAPTQPVHGCLQVLTFDPNKLPVSRFTRGEIDGAFDQESSNHYTRIYDGFPDLSVLAAHQLITTSIDQ